MAQGNPHPRDSWKPGQSGNPDGHPPGSRNNRTKEVIQQIIALGHKDPLTTLSELQNSDPDSSIRATAANMLAPYLHSKNATKPIAPDPVYFEQAVTLPRPTNIREAYENILKLTEMKALGQLDVVSADSLINDQRTVLNAMVDEAKLIAASGDPSRDQAIRIEGGMPPLPGTDVIMPTDQQLNGHQLELEVVIPVHGAPEPPKSDYGIPEDKLPHE
jgi:hypothetical protein